VIPIRLPAPRERPGDIRLLVRHFLSQLNQRHQRNVAIAPAALSSLVSYPWPGNIRQLYNVCERIVLLSRSDEIDEATVDYVLVTSPGPVARGARAASAPAAAPEPEVGAVRGYQPVGAGDKEQIAGRAARPRRQQVAHPKALNLTLRQLNYGSRCSASRSRRRTKCEQFVYSLCTCTKSRFVSSDDS
jgi:Nif-specific regulatory protein